MTLFLNSHHSIVKLADAKEAIAKIAQPNVPTFATHEPPFDEFFKMAGKYGRIKNFIIVGRGGAITNFKAVFEALGAHLTTKHHYYLDTNDPVAIQILKRKCLPDDTLAIVISQSGKTIDVIESLLALEGYQKLFITAEDESPMKHIQEIKEFDYVAHPPVPGRFSASTASTLLPAAMLYIDAKQLYAGMQSSYNHCHPGRQAGENPALELAALLATLEQKGFTDVIVPLFSKQLAGFGELITQLMHESACKNASGLTILARPANELHAGQRIFAGRKNAVLLPHLVQGTEHDITLGVPMEYRDLKLGSSTVGSLDGNSLHRALHARFEALCGRAINARIPLCTVTLDAVTPYSVGELIGFWQYVAFYSAILRGVDPYTQPETDALKLREMELRRQ